MSQSTEMLSLLTAATVAIAALAEARDFADALRARVSTGADVAHCVAAAAPRPSPAAPAAPRLRT